MGRPREFDPDEALCAALKVFWAKGYEGSSMTDLTEAMGITRPSLYAAFGNKEALFHKVLERYEDQYMGFVAEALAAPTARETVEKMLVGFVDSQTEEACPQGCLGTNGALACSEAGDPIRKELISRRTLGEERLRLRLERALTEGDLPAGQNPAALARFVMTIAQGCSVQAASGVDRASLRQVVSMAMAGWPSA